MIAGPRWLIRSNASLGCSSVAGVWLLPEPKGISLEELTETRPASQPRVGQLTRPG